MTAVDKEKRYEFDDNFQYQILAVVVQDKSFLLANREVVQPQFFSTTALYDLCNLIIKVFKEYDRVPTKEILIEELKLFCQTPGKEVCFPSYKEGIDRMFNMDVLSASDYIKDKVKIFARKAAWRAAVKKIFKEGGLLDNNSFEEAANTVLAANMIGQGSEGEMYDFFANAQQRFKNKCLPTESGHPTGFPALDRCLSQGGVLDGWLSFVVGLSGQGKSIVLSNLAMAEVRNRGNVLIVSAEMTYDEVSERLDGMATGIPRHEIKNHKDDYFNRMKGLEMLGGRLFVHEVQPQSTSSNDLRAILKNYKILHNFVPTMILFDYGDIGKPNEPQPNERLTQIAIFNELAGIAKEYRVPVWTASQANGQAWHQWKNGEDVGAENVSEAKGKIHIAHFVVSMTVEPNEDPESPTAKIHFKIIKNRGGKNHVKFTGIIDYETMIISTPAGLEERSSSSGSETKKEKVVKEVTLKKRDDLVSLLAKKEEESMNGKES